MVDDSVGSCARKVSTCARRCDDVTVFEVQGSSGTRNLPLCLARCLECASGLVLPLRVVPGSVFEWCVLRQLLGE
jgi:hypothetical protein